MKTINDSAIFNTLIKNSALLGSLKAIDVNRDNVPVSSMKDTFDMINRRMNYPTKSPIVSLLQSGKIKLVHNPGVVKTPKYLTVFGRRSATNINQSVYIVDIGRYARGNKDTELLMNARTLYALLQNALVIHILSEKWGVITQNDIIRKHGAITYSKLASKILVKLYAIDSDKLKSDTIRFLLAKFFLKTICGISIDENSLNQIAYASCLSGSTLSGILNVEKSLEENAYDDIMTFFTNLKKIPGLESINVRSFTENWARMYGEGSVLAIDYLPSFLGMIFSTIMLGNIVKDPVVASIAERDITSVYNAFSKML